MRVCTGSAPSSVCSGDCHSEGLKLRWEWMVEGNTGTKPESAPGPIDLSPFCVSAEEATGIGLQLLFCEESQEAMRGHQGWGRCCCVNRAAESDWAASFSFPPLPMPLAVTVGGRGSPRPLSGCQWDLPAWMSLVALYH